MRVRFPDPGEGILLPELFLCNVRVGISLEDVDSHSVVLAPQVWMIIVCRLPWWAGWRRFRLVLKLLLAVGGWLWTRRKN